MMTRFSLKMSKGDKSKSQGSEDSEDSGGQQGRDSFADVLKQGVFVLVSVLVLVSVFEDCPCMLLTFQTSVVIFFKWIRYGYGRSHLSWDFYFLFVCLRRVINPGTRSCTNQGGPTAVEIDLDTTTNVAWGHSSKPPSHKAHLHKPYKTVRIGDQQQLFMRYGLVQYATWFTMHESL